MNAPCADEWTAIFYPQGFSGKGDVECQFQEHFATREQCVAWGEEMIKSNNGAEYTCGRGCSYNKQCEYGCIEVYEPITETVDRTTSIDPVIEAYLLSQEEFAWTTEDDGKHVCVFQHLTRERDISPFEVWVRCSEFVLRNGEIEEKSGLSIPVKLTYPDNISVLSVENFSYETPGSGSDYGPDIERIFSQESQEFMRVHHDRMLVDLQFVMGEKAIELFAEHNPSFPYSMKQNCYKDENCLLPMSYAVRSNCPYNMECREKKCEVVCMWRNECPTCAQE
ncbi:MAG: hypothetical protein WCX61_00260 [Candidatus Peribacteraceae bacterium]|jgi:hypothetical protein